MWPSNQVLMGIAGVFGGFVGCTGLYMHSHLQKQFKQTIFVRDSLAKLRENEAAKYLLGKNRLINLLLVSYHMILLTTGTPIRDFNIHFHDTENNYKSEEAALNKIPVKGPHGHGWYFIRAEPRGEDGKWVGVRLELEIEKTSMLEEEKYRDKRLVVFDCERHGTMILKSSI